MHVANRLKKRTIHRMMVLEVGVAVARFQTADDRGAGSGGHLMKIGIACGGFNARPWEAGSLVQSESGTGSCRKGLCKYPKKCQ